MSIDVEQLRAALSGGPQSMAGLLGDHPNPIVRLLVEQWSQRAQVEEPEPAAPVATGPSDHLLRKRIARLHAELALRDDFLGVLAQALGACELCWGEDTLCADCHGRGRPAWRAPEREQFKRFIAPAARRLASSQRALRKNHSSIVPRDSQPTPSATGELS